MKVALIDFDGTITKENLFPEIGELRPNVIESIKKMQANGWKCCLWTCRNNETLEAAKKFLEFKGLVMDGYNESPYDQKYTDHGRKPIADIYIDDATYPVRLFNKDDKNRLLDWEEIARNLC